MKFQWLISAVGLERFVQIRCKLPITNSPQSDTVYVAIWSSKGESDKISQTLQYSLSLRFTHPTDTGKMHQIFQGDRSKLIPTASEVHKNKWFARQGQSEEKGQACEDQNSWFPGQRSFISTQCCLLQRVSKCAHFHATDSQGFQISPHSHGHLRPVNRIWLAVLPSCITRRALMKVCYTLRARRI